MAGPTVSSGMLTLQPQDPGVLPVQLKCKGFPQAPHVSTKAGPTTQVRGRRRVCGAWNAWTCSSQYPPSTQWPRGARYLRHLVLAVPSIQCSAGRTPSPPPSPASHAPVSAGPTFHLLLQTQHPSHLCSPSPHWPPSTHCSLSLSTEGGLHDGRNLAVFH